MLILTRKAGESIVVGNSIRVTVVELSGTTVKLAFDAPPEVSIHREEVYREIAAVNRAAVDLEAGKSER
jgi:carbon storage regulator